jgi:HAD superfamily hydrolase (TIGR01509 family)
VKRPVEAVIFDLDGTLIDSFAGMIATARSVLADGGHPLPTAAELHLMLRRGLLLDEVFDHLGVVPDLIPGLMLAYRERYAANAVLQVAAYAEAVPCLRALAEAGLPLAVATSKRHDIAERALQAARLRSWFSAVIGHDSVVNPKPAPDMVTAIAERLKVTADRCVVVGDSPYDVRMGKAAGATTVGIRGDDPGSEALVASDPDFLIDRLSELPPVVLSLR